MVASGAWPLVRFDPRRAQAGENALRLDSGPPKVKVADYMRNEAASAAPTPSTRRPTRTSAPSPSAARRSATRSISNWRAMKAPAREA